MSYKNNLIISNTGMLIEDANKNDMTKHELEQEKNLNVLLGILIFLFFIFALILKVFVL